MLQTWEQFGDIKDSFWWLVEQALWLFGDSGLENNLGALWDQQRLDIEEKLDSFEKKLRIISSIVGILVWYIVWKLLFDIVFGLSNVYKKITSFIS